jgi:putative cardiolipin synthase
MVSDDPAKGLGLAAPEALLPQTVKEIIGEPATKVELVSPYFVPAAAGADAFVALAERGVNVTVLTNSLESTDVAPVHAGYAKRHKSLLETGITLYEWRYLSPDTRANKRAVLVGSSGSVCCAIPPRTCTMWIRRPSCCGHRSSVTLMSTLGSVI